MIDIIKKKLIPIFILLIVICVLFTTRVNGAVQDTSNYYDAYNSMEHDLDIVRNWLNANFSSYTEFTQYLFNRFGVSTSAHYIGMVDTYNSSTSGRIGFYLLPVSTNFTVVDMTYYGISTKGFQTSGTHVNIYIYPSNANYEQSKYIGDCNTNATPLTFFSGYYNLKIDSLFSPNTITTNQLIDNTDEMNLHLQEQNDFLQNSNVIDDSSISDYSNQIDSSVSSIKDDFDNSNEKTYLTNYFEYLTADNSEDYGSVESIDLSFSAFNHDVNIHIPSSLTKDFILNSICHGNVTQRNNLVTIIQSVYGLVFGVFFLKKFYEIFKRIITLNFEGFDTGTEIINML